MKNKLGLFLTILLVVLVVLGVAPPIRGVVAQPAAPAFWVAPDRGFNASGGQLGTTFTETVYGAAPDNTFLYQCNVRFDPTMLQLISITPTNATSGRSLLFSYDSLTTTGFSTSVDNTLGSALLGEALVGDEVLSARSDSICTLTFNITATPPPGGNLTCQISPGPWPDDQSYIDNPDGLDFPGLQGLNATYTFTGGSAPPPTRHEVVVSSVTPSSDHVNQGNLLPFSVVALNNGTVTETFDVNATYDGTLIGKQTVTSLAAGNTQTLTFSWNTAGVAAGNYTVTATATPVTGQTDLSNISKTAEIEVLMPRRQVVVSSVAPSSANVTQGGSLSFSVVVLNNGTVTETSVVVNATANGTLIGQQTVSSLGAGNTTALTFTWSTVGVSVGNDIVTATVTPVANQTDLSGVSKSVTVQILAVSVEQYRLTVTSLYGSPTPLTGWFNPGASITESVTSTVSGGSGIQYVCTGWTGTGSVPASGVASSVTFAITVNSTITWNWRTQCYLTVTSSYGYPNPSSGWFDSGSGITESVTSPGSDGSGKRYVCTGWAGTGNVPGSGSGTAITFTIIQASTITWNWKTQHQVTLDESGVGSGLTSTVVTVDSVNYAMSSLPVSFWWDNDSSHSFSFASPLTVASTQYVWSSTSGPSPLQSGTLTVTGSGSIVGNYEVQMSHAVQPLLPFSLLLASSIGLALLGASVLSMFLGIFKKTHRGEHSH